MVYVQQKGAYSGFKNDSRGLARVREPPRELLVAATFG